MKASFGEGAKDTYLPPPSPPHNHLTQIRVVKLTGKYTKKPPSSLSTPLSRYFKNPSPYRHLTYICI